MAKVIALAAKDLRVLIADKGNVFWVFGFPTIFALLFGAVYSGAGNGPSGMKVAVVDEDGSELSGMYVSHLESEEALDVTCLDRQEALTRVRKGGVAAAVVISRTARMRSHWSSEGRSRPEGSPPCPGCPSSRLMPAAPTSIRSFYMPLQ